VILEEYKAWRGVYMTLRDLLSIPFVLGMESVEKDHSSWLRRAEYPEIPDCYLEAEWTAKPVVSLLDELEQLKLKCIFGMLHRGESILVPREPLKSARPEFQLKQYGFPQYIEHLDTNIEILRTKGIFKDIHN
jgi:hypothetical protein